MLENYKIRIGEGECLTGSQSGKVVLNFDNNGLYVSFLTTKTRTKAKSISSINFETVKKEEIEKGSGIAKIGMLMAASNNNQNIDEGRRIAGTMALKSLAEDKIKTSELHCCSISYGKDSVTIVLADKKMEEKIALGFHNPKEFFKQSIDQGWAVTTPTGGWIMFFCMFPLWFLLVIVKSFQKKKWKKLINSDAYNDILAKL